MQREVTYEGFKTTAEECSIEGQTYYMIGCHVIPPGDLDHIGNYVQNSVNLKEQQDG